MLIVLSAVILACAILAGAVMAGRRIRELPVPLGVGLAHAGVAVTGLALLATGVFSQEQPVAVNAALLLFSLAFIGGIFLLVFRLDDGKPPRFMIFMHAFAAIAGLGLLLAGLAR